MRERVFAALARLVWIWTGLRSSRPIWRQLGRDHRKYGVKDQHYHTFSGRCWIPSRTSGRATGTVGTAAAWESALAYAARMMRSAAEADARDHPPWWVGEIIAHDRRSVSVAVLTIRPDKPLPYRPGQYVPVQVTKWPRVWRPYSIANAPRPTA